MFARNYARYYDKLNKRKPYQREIDFVYLWGECPKKILDIGCGTASYWKYFPPHVKIMGLEPSKAMRALSPHKNLIIPEYAEDIACLTENRRFMEIIGTADAVYALFNVVNYMLFHNWWYQIPVKPGGYFIFDVYDYDKMEKERFKKTVRHIGGVKRTITPKEVDRKRAILNISIEAEGRKFSEEHHLYLYDHSDINRYCHNNFEIVDEVSTPTWQKWYKLRRIK